MITHLLHCQPEREGYMNWRLECVDPERTTCATMGAPSECFLVPWFEELGGEMLGGGDWPVDPTFPLPVRWDGRSSDEPVIVYDPQESP